MADLRIRLGVADDAPALAPFAARTFADTFAADNRPEDIAAHLAQHYGAAQQTAELADPTVRTLLAFQDAVLVAYAQVRQGTPPSFVAHPAPVELRRFYVDRPAHGHGVARALMARVRDAARSLGGASLWLSVWERNPRAIAFYAREGFVDVGSTDFYVGPDRQTDRVMVARIDDGAVDDPFDLDRFVTAQASDYARALAELRAAKKETHWMWYVLPQLRGLGRSAYAVRYGIASAAEARAYLAHPILGARLRECVAALNGAPAGRSAQAILGPVDAAKYRSCVTLFGQVAPDDPAFATALAKFYDSVPDPRTLEILASAG